jgi:hypothetical protein
MKKIFLVLGVLISVNFVFGQELPRVVQVKPSVEFNVTKDDMAQLRQLAGGVGWEFEPNDQTNEGLKKIGIKRIRCINVDPLEGKFDATGNFQVDTAANGYLKSQLATCLAVGAQPHVIIATGLHSDLVLKEKDFKNQTKDPSLLGMVHTATFGPTDWNKFQNYCQAFFKYVLIDQKFPNACFEVSNEPDVGGIIAPRPPKPANGSRGAYEAYFKLFKNVALAAKKFEEQNPGLHVTLGGPATTWAYTFRFGDFNWLERFLLDVRLQKVKLDFIGLHFYGNLSPLTGPGGTYPSFAGMMEKTRHWRDKYLLEVPIWFTEWGSTYHTSLDPQSVHNGNNVGAAWSAAFLNQMLIEGADKALYLVTTDLRQEDKGKGKDIWGWPSLFTNNQVHGTHPKATYHVFTMMSKMAPKRIEAMNPGGTLGCIASRDDQGRLTVLLWNHSYRITEFGPGTEMGQDENIALRVAGADMFFKGPVRIQRYLVSKTFSNAFNLFEKGQKIDGRAELQKVEDCTTRPVDGTVNFGFIQPPSSVSFIEFVPAANLLKFATPERK